MINKFKDKLVNAIAEIPTLKVTMMGPRAVGKTSIMASIFSDTRDQVAGTELYFRPAMESAGDLITKRLQLMNVIEKRINLTDAPQTGAIEASNTPTNFNFEMGIKGRAKTIDISIRDFPGEYLTSRTSDVKQFIAESHVIMIAIDTPYLMEEEGKFNEEKNEVLRVVNFFRNNSETVKDKLVLLVPLKCERYFHDKVMDAVKLRVETAYSELIEFCKKTNIACATTPIQTLGGVEFDRFKENVTGLSAISKLSKYRFWGEKPEYKPMFCVQPLYYLLTYVANYYEWSQGQPKNIIERMRNSLASLLKNNDEFLHEIKKMSKNIMLEKNGYSILTTNTVFNIK